jgi:GNAT superfamily N-acetyltransferase
MTTVIALNQGPIELRPATPSDAAGIAAVFMDTCRSAYEGLLPPEFLTRYTPEVQIPRWTSHLDSLPASHRITLACQQHRVIGFIEVSLGRPSEKGPAIGNITVEDPTRMGEVDYLFVHPPSSRSGVGRLLLSAGESWLAAGGIDSAILWVFSDNAPARAFYEHRGWKFTGHEQLEPGLHKKGFSVHECLYRKTLIPRAGDLQPSRGA